MYYRSSDGARDWVRDLAMYAIVGQTFQIISENSLTF